MKKLSALLLATLAMSALPVSAEPQYWVLKPVPVLRTVGAGGQPPTPPELTMAVGVLPEGMLGKVYNFDFRTVTSIQGAGQDWGAVTWSLGGGTLPTGLSLSNDGKLTGRPTVKTETEGAGFTVLGSYKTASGQQAYTIKVGEAMLRVTKMALGSLHTCAVTTAGEAKCWGANGSGQLGTNSTTASLLPVTVPGLGVGVRSIAAGSTFSCAVTSAGAAKCWGQNLSGQLGNNSTTQSLTPGSVVGLETGVVEIKVGGSHVCALTGQGAVLCWGSNSSGRLGDGTTQNRLVPVNVTGLGSGVTSLSAGSTHTCAVTAAGAVKCWGFNGSGQLGTNNTTSSSVPEDVVGLGSGVVSIAAGTASTCAKTAAGGAKCWGSNGSGQLGNGGSTRSTIPVDVAGLTSGVRSLAVGDATACAATAAGAAKCWGQGVFGQLGTGSWIAQSNVPVDVQGLATGVEAVQPGLNHVCGFMTNGGMKCWGSNTDGQLGDNSKTNTLAPVNVFD
ncbi:RCC1 domain-containing protein [Acidovorax sp.]|uniref:RCC1 domain-containing protein n=1 Tax=Acidovorax sp. TaxID=1872122 RepID=UPI00391F80F5